MREGRRSGHAQNINTADIGAILSHRDKLQAENEELKKQLAAAKKPSAKKAKTSK